MNDKLAQMYRESQQSLLAALEAVEWVSHPLYRRYEAFCPWCLNYKREGHRKDCKRRIALGKQVCRPGQKA